MIKKFKKHLNMLFLFYPKTNKLKEFKEELLGVLMDKYDEYIIQGMSEEEAYKACVESIEDYRETLDVLANDTTEEVSAAQQKIWLLTGLAYIVGVIIVYFIASFASGAWDWTWLTFIGGVIVGMAMLAYVLLKISRKNSQFLVVRLCNFVITIMCTTGIYLLVSFLTTAWDFTWIIFLFGVGLGYGFDILYRFNYNVKSFKALDFGVITLLVAIILYFTLSFALANAWSWTWIIYVVWFFIQLVALVYRKMREFKLHANQIKTNKPTKIDINLSNNSKQENTSGEEFNLSESDKINDGITVDDESENK